MGEVVDLFRLLLHVPFLRSVRYVGQVVAHDVVVRCSVAEQGAAHVARLVEQQRGAAHRDNAHAARRTQLKLETTLCVRLSYRVVKIIPESEPLGFQA